MDTIYKDGAIFKSKKQKSFRLKATGKETKCFFEAKKIIKDGVISPTLNNYSKDAFELEIQLTEYQKKLREKLLVISKNIKEIALSIDKTKEYDIICALGGNISLIEIELKKLENGTDN